jgi:hypothetical protein
LCLVNPDSPNSLLATTHTNKFYGIHHGRRHQINDHQLRSGTPAGLIIIISELSNIGQTPSSMPDYLDQMILETRDLPSSGGSNFSLWKNRGYRRIYDYKHTPGAGFCFLVPDLVASGKSDMGDL